MSAMSKTSSHTASPAGIREDVILWAAITLLLVAVAACALVSAYVAGGLGEASLVGS
jgi:hypothetical protein